MGWVYGRHGLCCKTVGSPVAMPPPHTPLWVETRTWWKLEAQFWASAAWALSVSCLSALFSTVTLPSPICLTNRRNYTTVGGVWGGGGGEMTARQHWSLIDHFYTNVLLVSYQPEVTQDNKTVKKKKNEERGGERCVQRNGACSKMVGQLSGKTLIRSSPQCSVTWGRRPLRRAHWPSASAPLRGYTLLSCHISNNVV